MFRFVALLAAIVGAAAFAPVSRVSTRSALRMGYENELGVSEPLGYFDPLSLARDVDQETFDFCTFLQHLCGAWNSTSNIAHSLTPLAVQTAPPSSSTAA
jgi:hypothetical protein